MSICCQSIVDLSLKAAVEFLQSRECESRQTPTYGRLRACVVERGHRHIKTLFCRRDFADLLCQATRPGGHSQGRRKKVPVQGRSRHALSLNAVCWLFLVSIDI